MCGGTLKKVLISVISILSFFCEVNSKSLKIVYPRLVTRSKRSNEDGIELNISDDESEEFALYLWKNEHLVTKGAKVEWHFANGTKMLQNLYQPIEGKSMKITNAFFTYQICINLPFLSFFMLSRFGYTLKRLLLGLLFSQLHIGKKRLFCIVV